jgi:hypothetical protein
VRWRFASALAVFAVALALVLSWSVGVFRVDTAGCTKMGPDVVQVMDVGMAHDAKLGAVYGVRRDKDSLVLAARIPGEGVAVWLGYPTPPGSGVSQPLLDSFVDPINAVAADNWRLPSGVASGGRKPPEGYGKGWENEMFRLYRGTKGYQQAVACLR